VVATVADTAGVTTDAAVEVVTATAMTIAATAEAAMTVLLALTATLPVMIATEATAVEVETVEATTGLPVVRRRRGTLLISVTLLEGLALPQRVTTMTVVATTKSQGTGRVTSLEY
jgi:hypothetical protein